MRPVRVDKATVLVTLKENRAKHRDIFLEAIEGYRTEVIEQLERHIVEMKSGKPKRTYISIPYPEDHTSDYDDAIDMLEMSVDSVVELDSDAFQAFYKDKWGWKNQFLASNSGYSRTAYMALQTNEEELDA